MRSQSYMTRALRSSDPRYLQILTKLGGYGVAPSPPPFVPAPLPIPPTYDPAPIEDEKAKGDEKAKVDDTPPDNLGLELKAAREEYERVTGKRPFNGWDVAELLKRIADYKKANK